MVTVVGESSSSPAVVVNDRSSTSSSLIVTEGARVVTVDGMPNTDDDGDDPVKDELLGGEGDEKKTDETVGSPEITVMEAKLDGVVEVPVDS